MPVHSFKFKKLNSRSIQVASLATVSIFCALANAQGIVEGENSTTSEDNLSLWGISTKSSLSLALNSSSFKNNIVQVPKGNTSTESLALVANGQYVLSPRLALTASLPYESTKFESFQSAPGLTIAAKGYDKKFGDLSLGIRYLLLPESNGFALLGSAAVSTTTQSNPSDKRLSIGLNPRWRINDNLVAAATIGVNQSQRFKGSQSIGAGLIWRITPAFTVSPNIGLTRNDAFQDNGRRNSISTGLSAFYDLDANWRLRTSASLAQISPNVFRGVEQTDKVKATNLSIGLTRFF